LENKNADNIFLNHLKIWQKNEQKENQFPCVFVRVIEKDIERKTESETEREQRDNREKSESREKIESERERERDR